MTTDQGKATSFGNAAESYDRVRPGPPAAALDWLVPDPCPVAVDLAAGTGLFTRALAGRAGHIIAVEPDARMREVLAAKTPGAQVLQGWGEAMPLPDACADAVFVSVAWHWLDPARAVPEIARVLRPGGRLGLIWTIRDRETDWCAELDLLRRTSVGSGVTVPQTLDDVRAGLRSEQSVRLPPGAPFSGEQEASFPFTLSLTVDHALEWLTTSSGFLTAPEAAQEAARARCRAALAAHAEPARPGDTPVIRMPMRSVCWRARRAG